jgi:hypothetical protein
MGFHRFFRSTFLKELSKAITILWGIGFTIVLWGIWWFAFLNGGNVTITINTIGEMWVEMFIGIVIFPIMVYGAYIELREFSQRKRKIRKSLMWLLSLEKTESL